MKPTNNHLLDKILTELQNVTTDMESDWTANKNRGKAKASILDYIRQEIIGEDTPIPEYDANLNFDWDGTKKLNDFRQSQRKALEDI